MLTQKLVKRKDHEIMENLHESLNQENLAPEQHFVDSAYVNTELLISSPEKHGINLIGPIQKDPQWQAKEGKGYSLANFKVDWQKQVVECPHGKQSGTWNPKINRYQQSVIQITFKKSDCQSCPAISNCTKSKSGFRTLTLRPQKFQETLEKARERQETREFKQQFGIRSGVEGTISQGTRAFGLRRCRYLGFAKTRLQHILTACAINLWRIWEWWNDNYLFGHTTSRFASLAP